MSQSTPSPEEMSRSQLVARVKQLESDIEDLRELSGKRTAETNKRMSEIEQHLTDLQTAVESHGDQLKAVANTASEPTDKDEKVASIAAFAVQKADTATETVLVDVDELRGCTGVTRRYAYELIDTLGEDSQHEWATVREATTVTTGKGKRQKKKALKVDCDSLRRNSHDDEVVNLFNTRTTEEER